VNARATITTLTPDEARRFMVAHHGLRQPIAGPPDEAVRRLLEARRCIQLDPLDVLGTNADLVALARVDGLARGDVYRHLGGHAFEHFAKERCLLPASAFPYYRGQAAETSWWSHGERQRRVPEATVAAVLRAVKAHGPITAAELDARGDWGKVEPLDWSGWRGTSKAASMALEILWTRCEVVVSGRAPASTGAGRGAKLWDVPRRALGAWGQKRARPPHTFARWALLERVEAAGLLARAAGASWSMLGEVRTSALPDALVAEGLVEEVRIAGQPRTYLAPAGFRDRPAPDDDGRMRLLGPLDACIWDRKLVAHAFGFDYVWEVYKPAATRRFGWYVCPLVLDGWLVGRLEGRVDDGVLRIDNVWPEPRVAGRPGLDKRRLRALLERHAQALGARGFTLPKA